MHADLRQERRQKNLRAFKVGVSPVLVATDIAARGLDVNDVKVVVQYDPPVGVEDYVHRIGRTGRAGKKGSSVLFLGPSDAKAARDAVEVLEAQEQDVPADLKELAAKPIDNWKARNQARRKRDRDEGASA